MHASSDVNSLHNGKVTAMQCMVDPPRLNGPLPAFSQLGLRVGRRDHHLVEQLDAGERDAVLNKISCSSGGVGDSRKGRDSDGRWKQRGKLEGGCAITATVSISRVPA